ncbi:ABC transporter ATP-binding protein [Nocardiopsis sp. RSe5-2]|uniref:ABC transporter ATP-binding protein n=1 Tax=Nocardiopsis endophytica TaxID=3018445 RepID=A0ABT4TWX7_9ACTN|nr:ABC transporter ATP-binding protein [Nocardiopsis endophytica]MDA2809204.1 ABC transporter ATP-binding protein [Nocardiopsis endophytica]
MATDTAADPAAAPAAASAADSAADRASGPPADTGTSRLLRPYAGGLAGVVVLHVLGAVAGLAPLIAVAETGRELLAPGPPDADRVWAAVAFGAVGLLVRLVLTSAASGAAHVLDGRVQLTLRRALAARLGRAPVAALSRRRTGELAKVVGDGVSAVHPFIAHTPGELATSFAVPLVSLVYLFTVDWRLTLVTLAPVALAVALVPLLTTPARRRVEEEFETAMGRISDAVLEFVRGIAVVKAFGGAGRSHRAFRTAVERFVASFLRMVRGLAPVGAAMQLALSPPVVLGTVLAGGAFLIARGGMEPADLPPFLLLGLGLTAPVAALGHGFDDMLAARRAIGRIREVLAEPPLPEPARPRTPRGHRVELRGVRFGYGDGREVLRGVDLVLEPGTVTAVVGPSGGGKSTLVRLLPRFFDPTAGSVRLGGVDLRDIAAPDLSAAVSFVFQEVFLLRAPVADNIALAVPDADRDDVVRAARRARIHDRILRLPDGYDTVLGDGIRLSAGEEQRIALARALLADTPVLVLDEATAFADPETERAVRRALAPRGDRTLLVIAHRPETVADADTVVVLEDGTVVSGAHTPEESR